MVVAPLQSGVGGSLALLLLLAGLALALAEAVVPGANLVVLGVALVAAGAVGLLLGPLAGPLLLGVLVFVFGGAALYGYRELDIYGGKGSGRTTDSDALRGRSGRVTEAVTPTAGEVKLDEGGFNPHYAARSVDGEIPEGTEVVVVDPGGGSVLTVESVAPGEDEIDRELARERRRSRERAAEDGDADSVRGDANDAAEDERERERERE